jgi:cytochrome c-type biogenesis protein CcsB
LGGGGRFKTAMAGMNAYVVESVDDMTSPMNLEMDIIQDKANVYDEITYRCVAFGFPLLTIGIILGGMWANEAWGNYWSWDPKESMSLVTLLGYGVYLHLRINGEHTARTLSWVSVTGFLLMLVTYFGVNLMGIGLHSYGKIG